MSSGAGGVLPCPGFPVVPGGALWPALALAAEAPAAAPAA